MNISVAGVPASRKAPGVLLNVVLGGPGTASGSAEVRLLLLGNMIATAITKASPAFTTAAGTYKVGSTPIAQAIRILSEQDAILRFGAGSELHLMAAAVFAQYQDCPLYACPVAEPGGASPAAANIYVSGTATASGTLHLWIAGTPVDVNIPSGSTAAQTVDAITNAILGVTGLPVYAQYAAGPVSPVTLTAKNAGTRGNLLTIRGTLDSGTTTAEVPSNILGTTPPTTVATLFGVTVAFSSAAADATTTAKYLVGGVGTDTAELGTALSAIAKDRYHRIAIAGTDGTTTNSSIDRLSSALTSQASPTKGIRQQGIVGVVTTLSASIGTGSVSAFVNAPRVQLVLHPRAEQTPAVIAAQYAAARLGGDSTVGGFSIGEAIDPAANLDDIRLATVTLQPYDGDRLSPDDPDTALQYGLSPLIPSAARAGYVQICRSVTSRWKDDTGAPNYGVLDTSDVTVTDYVADRIAQNYAVTFKGYRLAPDADQPPEVERCTTPSLVRAWLHAQLKLEETAGHIIEVDARMTLCRVIAQSGSAWWLNAEIPVVPIPGLHVFAANVRQLSPGL